MNKCTNLYFLSTVACQLARCLSEDELSLLSADPVVLSDMLSNLQTRQDICGEKESTPDSKNTSDEDRESDEETPLDPSRQISSGNNIIECQTIR